MAYGILHQFPGGTKEQYETSLAAVHVTVDKLPEGQIFHVAGPSAGGWTVNGGLRHQREVSRLPRRRRPSKFTLCSRSKAQPSCGCLGSRLTHLKAATEFFQKNFPAAGRPLANVYDIIMSRAGVLRPA